MDASDQPAKPPRKRPLWPVIILVFLGAMMGFIFSGGLDHLGPPPSQKINAWLVHCDGERFPISLNRNGEGLLVVPGQIAAAPLPPVAGDGETFSDGKAVVEIDGERITIWPNGKSQAPLPCNNSTR